MNLTLEEIQYYEEELTSLTQHIDLTFVGGANIKRKLNELAAHSLLQRIRERYGLPAGGAVGHMAFVGDSGTGKTMIAQMLGSFLHRLGYLESGHVVKVTRHDLVGQYIGHTAPKTKEVVNSAMGGVLYVKNAHNIYRPGNERDYGGEAIDILLQTMELYREDFLMVFSGPANKMNTLYSSNPGLSSRITHHLLFSGFGPEQLETLSNTYLEDNHLCLDATITSELGLYMHGQKTIIRKTPIKKMADRIVSKGKKYYIVFGEASQEAWETGREAVSQARKRLRTKIEELKARPPKGTGRADGAFTVADDENVSHINANTPHND